MNKFAIPTILVATVMVAGVFAFAPINQASTVHTGLQIDLVEAISGASAISSSATLSNTFAGATTVCHTVFMESTETFTIQDIEILSTIDANLPDNNDKVRLEYVVAFPKEYASTSAGITAAFLDESIRHLCSDCNDVAAVIINEGNWSSNTNTGSFSAIEIDNDTHANMSFGPNTKIFVSILQVEDDGDAGDIDTTVTFYLTGPIATDLTITEFTNQADPAP